MKRIFYTLFAAFLLLGTGCEKPEEPLFEPDTTFHKTGTVTLLASIENCETKASMTNNGEARWEAGDKIAVACTDGTLVTFSLDGTGGSRRAFFKGDIPSGKELGGYAFYPASAVKSLSGTNVSAELPASIGVGGCSMMAAKIGDTYEITFIQLLSYITVQVGNIPNGAEQLLITADKALSGAYTFDVNQAMENGIPAAEGTASLTATLNGKQTSGTYAVAIPVAEYGSLQVTTLNNKGKEMSKGDLLPAKTLLARSAQRAFEITLPEYKAPKPEIPGTILVCDIYWAKGNLQHYVGSTDEGFQTDWRIAPAQWHYVNCENAAGKAVTFKPTNYDQCDHFNFGGISDPFSNDAAGSMNGAVGIDISGKMFTDQACTAATADYSAAKYGDLAWWASKGKYRMPRPSEIQTLMDKASRKPGTYVTPDGKTVAGILFYNPEDGEAPVVSDEEVALTDADLETGVFFVKSGRRYTAQALQVNVQGTQGPYWASETRTFDAATADLCYGTVMHINSMTPTFPYSNAAFDSKCGFSIKPVLDEK